MPNHDKPCIFCEIAAGRLPARIVARTENSVAILDYRPLYFGHTLVFPAGHYPTLMDFPDGLLGGFFTDVKRVARAVEYATAADGIFDAINNRMSQSVPHLHVHVVPRRHKDNMRHFMWPRRKYPDGDSAEAVRARIAEAVVRLEKGGDAEWEKMREFVLALKDLPGVIGGESCREQLDRFWREMREAGDYDPQAISSREGAIGTILADTGLSERFVKEMTEKRK